MMDNTGATAVDGFVLDGWADHLPTLVELARQGPATHPALEALRDELMEPFFAETLNLSTDFVTIGAVPDGSVDAVTAAVMLEWGYCSHYYTGKGIPRLPREDRRPGTRTYTLTAHVGLGPTSVLIATLQAVVGDTVPALSLFAPIDVAAQPDTSGPHRVGELRRFSVSPVLEVSPASDDRLIGTLRDYRRRLYFELYRYSNRYFVGSQTSLVYGVATPEIYRFFTRSGMPMVPVTGTALVDSAEVRCLQQNFALYWRPTEPSARQPALYRILLPTD